MMGEPVSIAAKEGQYHIVLLAALEDVQFFTISPMKTPI